MSDLKLGANGDLEIINGEQILTTGKVATSQRISQRFKLILGEWFLRKDRGIPFQTQIFVKQIRPNVIDAIFKREVISDPAVIELQQFSLDLDGPTRTLTVTFKALTTDGIIDLTETLTI